MEKTIDHLFKVFNHLVRELQVYFISGVLVISNILVIDYFHYNSSLYNFVSNKNLIIPCAIIAYIIGQIAMAMFHFLFELKKTDIKIAKWFGFEYNVESAVLPSIYKKDKEAYIHFIERYVVLTMMRWTLSASLFINFCVDLSFAIFKNSYWQINLLTVISLISSIFMYILCIRTEKDYADRIQSMKNSS